MRVYNNYDLIIQCYLSGQMDCAAFQALIQVDEVFKKYVENQIKLEERGVLN